MLYIKADAIVPALVSITMNTNSGTAGTVSLNAYTPQITTVYQRIEIPLADFGINPLTTIFESITVENNNPMLMNYYLKDIYSTVS